MTRPRAPWTIAAVTALVLVALGVPATAGPSPWTRAPATGRVDVASRGTKPMPSLVPVGRDALTRALERGRVDDATYALERAKALFDLAGARERWGEVRRAAPRDATLILRDLVARFGRLSTAEQRQARALLARPTDGLTDPLGQGYAVPEATPVCSTNGCIHYVGTTVDAPATTDTDLDGIPDYVESTRDTFEEVWATEVMTYGYRAPKSDLTSTNNGGSALIDIYVAQIGDEGLYGYCTTDDPNAFSGTYPYSDFSAYCVVDNDYNIAEFPPPVASGLAGLQVTMAHEFFHAIQFAYDTLEDRWFMESTATWMEDEVYDAVNDNLQYLPTSPISQPRRPLDANNTAFNVYGNWIWPRFLVESSGDRDIVRRAWKNAADWMGARDQYGIKAYATEIADVGAKFRWAFADFAMFNDVPTELYEEGASYPIPPAQTVRVTRTDGGGSGHKILDHLTSRYIWFLPGRGVAADAKLWVMMDGPAYRAGPEASVVVFFVSGKVRFHPLAISKAGVAEIVVPFGRGKIAEVDLVMTNASTRLVNGDCWVDQSWDYSCAGFPADDGMRFDWAAVLLQ